MDKSRSIQQRKTIPRLEGTHYKGVSQYIVIHYYILQRREEKEEKRVSLLLGFSFTRQLKEISVNLHASIEIFRKEIDAAISRGCKSVDEREARAERRYST